MARTKEVHFFDREDIDWNAPPYEEFHGQFDFSRPNVRRGETTPIYMFWPDSLRRIHAYNPDARLVAVLRHPIYRAYSHWKMEVVRDDENLSFDEAVSRAGRERIGKSEFNARRYSYFERGFYRRQVETMFNLFDRQRCLVMTSDDLRADPRNAIERVCDLLEIDPTALPASRPRYIVSIDSRTVPEIDSTIPSRYIDLFRRDIIDTMHLTGLDLNPWLSPEYREHDSPNP